MRQAARDVMWMIFFCSFVVLGMLLVFGMPWVQMIQMPFALIAMGTAGISGIVLVST